MQIYLYIYIYIYSYIYIFIYRSYVVPARCLLIFLNCPRELFVPEKTTTKTLNPKKIEIHPYPKSKNRTTVFLVFIAFLIYFLLFFVRPI